ncbi:hypothetical protein PPYR_14810 [Photinus pyralis]|uniref:LRRCT domain-containing protein n=2 Tax=Photinus pyralis TaxID=7054 RepID=A0A5N4A6B5_PHOPY|nr:hypothetical protein PPYR_14810 [Photinus pyralis]
MHHNVGILLSLLFLLVQKSTTTCVVERNGWSGCTATCTSLEQIGYYLCDTTVKLSIENTTIPKLKETTIPKSKSSLRQLSLRNCQLEAIANNAFERMQALRQLNLQENKITAAGFLDKKLPLQVLNLNFNNLRSISVDGNLLGQLEELYASNNDLQKVKISSMRLRVLDLSYNRLLSDDNLNFTNVTTQLNVLNLSSNPLTTLRSHSFVYLRGLSQLYLKNCSLQSVESEAFRGLDNLNVLRLSDNLLRVLPQYVFVELSRLRELHLDNNHLYTLQAGDFKGLGALGFLNLSNNQIEALDKDVFQGLAGLDTLILANSKLKRVGVGVFPSTSNLNLANNSLEVLTIDVFSAVTGTIDLQFNPIRSLSEGTVSSALKAMSVDLVGVDFQSFKSGLSRFSGVRFLNLSHTNLRQIASNDFANLANLNNLNLSHNSLSVIVEDSFRGLSGLRSLWVRNNSIHEIRVGAFNGLQNLRILDLSQNFITHLSQGMLSGLQRLNALVLAQSHIVNIEPQTFQALAQLATLDLSHNKLVVLKANAFVGATGLNSLIITRNFIEEIAPGSFADLQQLSFLDLSFNNLEDLDSNMFKGLNQLQSLKLNGVSSQGRTTIKAGAFSSLPSLASIYLRQNHFKLLEGGAFSKLDNLKQVYFDGTTVTAIGKLRIPRHRAHHKFEPFRFTY